MNNLKQKTWVANKKKKGEKGVIDQLSLMKDNWFTSLVPADDTDPLLGTAATEAKAAKIQGAIKLLLAHSCFAI